MLPKTDGITVLKTLRSEGFDTPVILLTAKNEIPDKVLGLDSGADDYLAKPFNTEELLARIRALAVSYTHLRTDLLNITVIHYHDRITHCKSLLLVVCYIYKRNFKALLNTL